MVMQLQTHFSEKYIYLLQVKIILRLKFLTYSRLILTLLVSYL